MKRETPKLLQNPSQSSTPDRYRPSLSAKNQEQENPFAPECIHSKVYLLSPIKNQKWSLSNRENKLKLVIFFCLVKINNYKAKTYRKCYEWNKFATLMKTKGRREVLLCQICRCTPNVYSLSFLLTEPRYCSVFPDKNSLTCLPWSLVQ